MTLTVGIAFVIVFALVLLAVSAGFKYYEARRRHQVQDILETVSGAPPPTKTKILKDVPAANLNVLQAVLANLNFTVILKPLLQQAGMDWTAEKWITVMGAAAGFGMLFGFFVPIPAIASFSPAILAVLFGAAPLMLVRMKRNKRMAQIEEQFPEALDFMARSMRAGHAFTITLGMLGEELSDPLGLEIRTLFNEQNLGAPIDIALRNFVERVPALDVKFFASAVTLQKQTGGNLAEILGRLAYVIRERFQLRGKVKATSAHGRLTAMILLLLPVVTAILLCIVAPGYLDGMFNDPDGKWLIGGAVACQILGNFFIRRIIDIKV